MYDLHVSWVLTLGGRFFPPLLLLLVPRVSPYPDIQLPRIQWNFVWCVGCNWMTDSSYASHVLGAVSLVSSGPNRSSQIGENFKSCAKVLAPWYGQWNIHAGSRQNERSSKILDFIFLLNWASYICERKTTFAKAYGIKLRCYGEHVGEHIGNLGNILRTNSELIYCCCHQFILIHSWSHSLPRLGDMPFRLRSVLNGCGLHIEITLVGH